jgi:hypothetical protein
MENKYSRAIINDKYFKGNTKLRVPKINHSVQDDIALNEDNHNHFRPSWIESKGDKMIDEPEQETLKGKDLLKRVYQSGSGKMNYSKILDNITKNESKIIKHLDEHISSGEGDKNDVKHSKMLKKQISEINELQHIPASKAPKSNVIFKYSNPIVVQQKANNLYNKLIYLSTRPNKKYMMQNEDGVFVHFGDLKYEDFTKHGDQKRRENYLKRASNIKGNWKSDAYSPNSLSMRLLW